MKVIKAVHMTEKNREERQRLLDAALSAENEASKFRASAHAILRAAIGTTAEAYDQPFGKFSVQCTEDGCTALVIWDD